MKAISLSLAAISGAGFLFHNQLQSLMHPGNRGTLSAAGHHQAPEGVYYLRTSYAFPGAGGTTRWSAGQELRTTEDTLAANGMITLTDGRNIATVPETATTQDMDDAATLRQMEASSLSAVRQPAAQPQPQVVPPSSSEHLVAGRFHSTSLDAPAVHTNLPENIVSTAGAPIIYSGYNHTTVIVNRPVVGREVIVQQRTVQQRIVQPRSTPAPVGRNY